MLKKTFIYLFIYFLCISAHYKPKYESSLSHRIVYHCFVENYMIASYIILFSFFFFFQRIVKSFYCCTSLKLNQSFQQFESLDCGGSWPYFFRLVIHDNINSCSHFECTCQAHLDAC